MSDIVERLRAGEWGSDVEAADEIERLEFQAKANREAFAREVEINSRHTAEIERLQRRVESFEADQEFHQAQATKIRRLEDQCRDIRAATIEECAQVAMRYRNYPFAAAEVIAAAIRALKEQS